MNTSEQIKAIISDAQMRISEIHEGQSVKVYYRLASNRTAEDIIRLGADFFNLKYADIIGHRRLRELVNARYYIAYLIVKEYQLCTLMDCGLQMGGRDHSSIIHYCKRMEGELEIYAHARERYSEFLKYVNHPFEQAKAAGINRPKPSKVDGYVGKGARF